MNSNMLVFTRKKKSKWDKLREYLDFKVTLHYWDIKNFFTGAIMFITNTKRNYYNYDLQREEVIAGSYYIKNIVCDFGENVIMRFEYVNNDGEYVIEPCLLEYFGELK